MFPLQFHPLSGISPTGIETAHYFKDCVHLLVSCNRSSETAAGVGSKACTPNTWGGWLLHPDQSMARSPLISVLSLAGVSECH